MASLVPFWTVEDEAGNDRISAIAVGEAAFRERPLKSGITVVRDFKVPIGSRQRCCPSPTAFG